MIASVAGGGNSSNDGDRALDSIANVTVGGLAVDPTGTLYFAGTAGQAVRRIGSDGILGTVAGAPMVDPVGLDLAPDGTLVVADAGGNHIWRVTTDGRVTVIAGPGTGAPDGSGDGGPATAAPVHPSHVKVGPDGSIYFDDVPRYRIITPDGVVHAFAGTTTPGFAGDGGPATAALTGGADPTDSSYPDVEGSAIDAAGDVLITDNANSRIRKIDARGIITTIAGSGARGYTGDGGPALEATFQDPVDLALDAAGNLYISDHHNDVVRKLDTNGIITTVAGIGHLGGLGDCGPATQAALGPWPIAVRGGYLFIGDMANGRIRVVKL